MNYDKIKKEMAKEFIDSLMNEFPQLTMALLQSACRQTAVITGLKEYEEAIMDEAEKRGIK